MHWKTYMRLRREAQAAELAYDLSLVAELQRLNAALDRLGPRANRLE